MSYRCILVDLDIDGPIVSIVNLAVGLAKRVEARLIGFCAADVPFPTMGMASEGAAIAVDVWQEQRNEIEGRFKELRAEFEKLATASVELGWREMIGNPTRSLAQAARLANLVITGAQRGASTGDGYRVANPGSVVLQAGRPVLVAADGVEHLLAKRPSSPGRIRARRGVPSPMPCRCSSQQTR